MKGEAVLESPAVWYTYLERNKKQNEKLLDEHGVFKRCVLKMERMLCTENKCNGVA